MIWCILTILVVLDQKFLTSGPSVSIPQRVPDILGRDGCHATLQQSDRVFIIHAILVLDSDVVPGAANAEFCPGGYGDFAESLRISSLVVALDIRMPGEVSLVVANDGLRS